MPRPRKSRTICTRPEADYFKPRGVPMHDLSEVYLTLEGREAIRLADLEGRTQAEAAEVMGVSRHTFGRILADARRVVAQAIVEGLALSIQGGHYELDEGAQPPTRQETAPAHSEHGSAPIIECGNTTYEHPEGEQIMSKIAVTSEGPTLNDRVDPRFGRAAGFVVVDVETGESSYIDNGSSQTMSHGAGIQAAQNMARAGVSAVLTGYCGPKAFQALSAARISVGQDVENMTVGEAVELYKSGKVQMADAPNRQGHGR